MERLVLKALTQYGVQKHKVLDYFKEIGFDWINDDETPWCSAFVNWVALQCGYERSYRLHARSWLTMGEKVTDPQLGDLVVFWSQSPTNWRGVVGFFVNYSEDGKYIRCLGGNQLDQISIESYPVDRLLGFRRLLKIPQKKEDR